MKQLKLKDMNLRHPGLTPAMAGALYEAASVCLARHHEAPATLKLRADAETVSAQADWEQPTATMRRAYANSIDTTEWGAYGVSLAALEEYAGLVAIHRAETLSGADYYVSPYPANDPDDLENAIRFEVSGTDEGNSGACLNRMDKKIAQTQSAGHSRPAIAGVVGFREKLVLISPLIAP